MVDFAKLSARKRAERAGYCPLCHAANIIATATGPTCPHKPDRDDAWFPPKWGPANQNQGMSEAERLEWLRKKNLNSPCHPS
jgi:hypothetical protein